MLKYKHFVFDVDGTLLDTEFAVLHSLQDTLSNYLNECIPLDKLRFALGIPGEVTLLKFGIEDVNGAGMFWNAKMKEYLLHIKLFDGITEMLESLHEKGLKLGIVTSKTREEFETDFVPYGVGQYFDSIICVEDSTKPKPYPDPLFAYLGRNGVSAEEVIYIGDTDYDSQCARTAGVDFGLALWGCRNPEDIECKYKFADPSKILDEYER